MQKAKILVLFALLVPVCAFSYTKKSKQHETSKCHSEKHQSNKCHSNTHHFESICREKSFTDKDAKCTQQKLCEFPVKITKKGTYLVDKKIRHSKHCPAITIASDNVTLIFCNEASIELCDKATGITIDGNFVKIVGAKIKAKSDDATAIRIGSGVKNWTIDKSVFKGFHTAIVSDNFEDGVLTNADFYDCDEGFKQKSTGIAKRLFIKNIRADNRKDMHNNATESYAISLDGEVRDSTIEKGQLTASSLYCFKCRNCVVDDIEVFYSQIATPFIPGIQCGGPRGALLPTFNLNNDIPAELQQGCIGCRISNVKVTMLDDNETILFLIGIEALFCENCEIVDCQSTIKGNPELIDGVCILEAYCKNCTVSRCQVEGPSATGIFVCDPVDQCLFCQGSRILDCNVRNCWLGLSIYRCMAPVVDSCNIQQCVTGLSISEGSSNAIVSNCRISENSFVGLAYVPLSVGNIGAIFPPSFSPDPCPEDIRDPFNGVVTGTTFAGNATDIIDQIGDLNLGVNNNFF